MSISLVTSTLIGAGIMLYLVPLFEAKIWKQKRTELTSLVSIVHQEMTYQANRVATGAVTQEEAQAVIDKVNALRYKSNGSATISRHAGRSDLRHTASEPLSLYRQCYMAGCCSAANRIRKTHSNTQRGTGWGNHPPC